MKKQPSLHEIKKDISNTEKEVLDLTEEVFILAKNPLKPGVRFDIMKKEVAIRERKEFLKKLYGMVEKLGKNISTKL